MIITQLPYAAGLGFDTVVQDVETGMRWSFSRRANVDLPEDYAQLPLGKFKVNYSCITDAEVATLKTFFESQYGRYGEFRLLDPSGNLIPYSEDFTALQWDKTNGISIAGSTTDPFGGNLATRLSAAPGNSFILSIFGPADGGLNGFVVCASMWVKAESVNQNLFIGFVDSGFSRTDAEVYMVPMGSWKRISHTATLWDNNYFRVIIGGDGTWDASVIDVFGVQVAPTKGEGAYVRSPDNYGYHEYVRFDTDSFQRQAIGPNQNALQLPMFEYNVPS
jgi:hypothetical protein